MNLQETNNEICLPIHNFHKKRLEVFLITDLNLQKKMYQKLGGALLTAQL